MELHRVAGCLHFRCRSPDGAGDAVLTVDARAPLARAPGSLFADAADAGEHLVGMRFSADLRRDGRVRVQPIEHDPWQARFVAVAQARFAYLERFQEEHGVRLAYDHTLGMRGIRQIWGAARCC